MRSGLITCGLLAEAVSSGWMAVVYIALAVLLIGTIFTWRKVRPSSIVINRPLLLAAALVACLLVAVLWRIQDRTTGDDQSVHLVNIAGQNDNPPEKDPKNQTAGQGTKATDYLSPRYGYRLRLADSNWRAWESLSEIMPEAEFGGSNGDDVRGLVIPISLLGRTPRFEALAFALLARFGIAYPAAQMTSFREVENLQAQRFDLVRPVDGVPFQYSFMIAQQSGMAYVLAAWMPAGESTERKKLLDDWISRFELVPDAKALEVTQLDPRERMAHTQVFNDLGLYYFNSRHFDESQKCFRQAFEISLNDPVLLENVINSMQAMNQFGDALTYLEKYRGHFPEHSGLLARKAFLQAETRDTPGALGSYQELFAKNYRSTEALETYVGLLIESRQLDEALQQIERFLAEGDSPTVRRMEAMLYVEKRDFEKAIQLYQAQREGRPFDPELAYDLADCYLKAGEYRDGLAICEELLERRYDTPSTYFIKGQLESALKWFAAAKVSYEACVERDPSDATAQSHLQQISAMLGEGDNSAVKQPIVSVDLPVELNKEGTITEAQPYRQQYGACYLRRSTALQFASENKFVRTERQRIVLFDDSGVERFSTLQIEFDPTAERVFVNQLKITDADGKEVAVGKADDSYVLDSQQTDLIAGRKTLNVPVPGLQPGHIIDFQFSVQDLRSPKRMPFFRYQLQSELPVVEELLFVNADKKSFRHSFTGSWKDRPLPAGQCWSLSHPPVYCCEPSQAPFDTFVSQFMLADADATWEGISDEYLLAVADSLEVDPEVQKLATEVIGSAESDIVKLRLITRYVQDRLRYHPLAFGRRARQPTAVSTILKNRYGECKDHAVLLRQLLLAAGIDARIALLRINGSIDETLPSLDQFDHMVVYTKVGEQEHFLDCTDKEVPLELLPARGLASKQVLILGSSQAKDPTTVASNPIPEHRQPHRFAQTAPYPSDGNSVQMERKLTIANQTDVIAVDSVIMHGYMAANLREALKGVQPANRVTELQRQLTVVGNGAIQIQQVDVANLEDRGAPLVLNTTSLIKGRFKAANDTLVGQTPAIWERFLLHFQHVENRQTPFMLRYPLKLTSKVELATPTGYAVADLPAAEEKAQTCFITWDKVAKPTDNGVQVQFSAQRAAETYPANQYSDYCEAMQGALTALDQNVVFRSTTGVASTPRD
ncbi:MAG: DUF3857 domain-containing protein [Planctomycetota bacterium]|nr:DUF3857 domain-containing protein [Planctomycetota bacterium]